MSNTYYDDGEQSIIPDHELQDFLGQFSESVKPHIMDYLTHESNEIERRKDGIKGDCLRLMEKIDVIALATGQSDEDVVKTAKIAHHNNVDLSIPRLIDLQYIMIMSKQRLEARKRENEQH